jgi:crotonobetainyl-CoA:carnitine CoA-transferase CaiB-like acyl-CoA transferase
MWDYADLYSQRQAQERGLRVTVRDAQGRPIDLVGSPFHVSATGEPAGPPEARCPPGLGEHTAQVLRELCGLDEGRLRALREGGVIA